ncbi:hypothetical protein GLOIN_2v1792427 [Rhizophagus irregularis DAOM 181602=DAOM 197198]|nr:hypothetical protein GLOIN_2v1792427 [Rhizophagus irregularis DAOM 181602=DAOM 197198]
MKKGRFFNFNLQNSDNPNVRKRQQARFERKCRQVFHKSDLTADASLEDKLLASKRKGFLFQQSQNFRKPIILNIRRNFRFHYSVTILFSYRSLNPQHYPKCNEKYYYIAKYFDSNVHGSIFDPSYEINHRSRTTLLNLQRTTIIQHLSSILQLLLLIPLVLLHLILLRKMKDKKNLQPLKVEPMYKDGKLHSSLSHNEKKTLRPLQDKWFNGKTTTEIALYRDN